MKSYLKNPKPIILLGYPLDHSLSPKIHNHAFQLLGMDYVYFNYSIEPKKVVNIREYILNSPIIGGNVTVPYKEIMINYLDGISDIAGKVGAINTFYKKGDKIFGDNTDVYGFIKSLEGYEDYLKNKEVLLLGTGGASKATTVGLEILGVNQINVVSREKEKAITFSKNRSMVNPTVKFNPLSYNDLKNINLENIKTIINTTPVGMYENKSPIDISLFKRTQKLLCYDLIYNPSKTKFLLESEKKEFKILNGLDMLIGQAEKAFEIWTEKKFPTNEINKLL